MTVLRIAAVFAFATGLWQVIVWLTQVPHFILPGPGRVARQLWESRALIAENAQVTFLQIIVGLLLGTLLGVATAIQLAMSNVSRVLMRPVLIFAQAVPVFAIAPILTLWLGYGPASKIVMVVLIIYFPVASAFFDGLSRTPQGHLDLAHVMGASGLRQLLHLRIPHALPSLASGLRLAAVASPFGAVIGEWVGSSQGLGHLMLLSSGRAQTDMMFACLFVLALFTVLLYFLIDKLGVMVVSRYAEPGA
ncbi:MAG: ABC transporter permease [Alphaproteobacteria bacterium]|nr:ABC transporter permease [Alphaproteobacteria bacterium]